jgi:hypothetical protein
MCTPMARKLSRLRLPTAGLYRGLDTKLFQTVLAAAILFTTKDTITQATRRAMRRSKAVKIT